MNFPMNYEQYKFRTSEYNRLPRNEYEGRRNHKNRNNDDRELNNLIATIFSICCSCNKNDRSEEEVHREDNSL